MLEEYGKPVTFLGDGVPVYAETIKKNITVPYRFAPLHMNRQRAGAVALLAVSKQPIGGFAVHLVEL